MNTYKTFWELIKEALWHSKITVCVVLLSNTASITGLNVHSLFGWEWINSIDNIWWYMLILFSMAIIVIRIVWVAAKKVDECNLSASKVFTPVKLVRKIKDISIYLNEFYAGKNQVGVTMDEICNKMREIADKITGSRCCVSIKIIEGMSDGDYRLTVNDIGNCKVRNIAHDSHHKSRRETPEYNSAEHFIRDNTAYSTIASRLSKQGKIFYLNNDVDISNSYITTSPYLDENGNPANPPYKSELVLPIFDPNKKEDRFVFIGFLCIDSEDKNVFQKDDIVFELASMYADCLYGILPSFNNKKD